MVHRITGTDDGRYWFNMTSQVPGGDDPTGYNRFYWYVVNGTLYEEQI